MGDCKPPRQRIGPLLKDGVTRKCVYVPSGKPRGRPVGKAASAPSLKKLGQMAEQSRVKIDEEFLPKGPTMKPMAEARRREKIDEFLPTQASYNRREFERLKEGPVGEFYSRWARVRIPRERAADIMEEASTLSLIIKKSDLVRADKKILTRQVGQIYNKARKILAKPVRTGTGRPRGRPRKI